MSLTPPAGGRCLSAVLFVALVFLLVVPLASAQVVKIADEEYEIIETSHPYPAGSPAGEVVWSETLHWPDASYIAVHFERFELAPGDVLVLTDPEGRYRHTYEGKGFQQRGKDFWGLSILGDTMELALISYNQDHAAYGLVIDRWAHGYPHDLTPPGVDALCGTEDFRDIECYRDTYPTAYDVGRRAVRLIKNGSAHCTGWIASCENHIVTNEHCVGSQSELNSIEFQFEYKRSECGGGEVSTELQLQGGTLLEVEPTLDYALIMPELAGHDPQATYGFMQWDVREPDLEELMYIPGHPSGDPKRLSIESTHPEDQSGRCEVYATDRPACTSGAPVPDIGYYCDTEGGSSGSAVVSAETHRVISLHHCANCPNRGVPITAVYDDIQASEHPLPDCATCQPADPPTDLVTSSPADNEVLLDWQPVSGATLYHVYRNDTQCEEVMTEIATTTEPTYLDEDVAGEITYNYKVTAESDCGAESGFSNCSTETPSGLCTEPPRFDGLVSAESDDAGSCGITLDWEPGTARCGAIVYNVYRSTIAGFEPGPGNLIASCLNETTYHDPDVLGGTEYHYVVRAEDGTTNGSGPCNGGNLDPNTLSEAAAATGPDEVFYSQDFESGLAGWIISEEWQVGVPQGRGGSGGNPDPMGAYQGGAALGHDISGQGAHEGDYENNLSADSSGATSPPFDASGRDVVYMRFARWLGTHAGPGDQARVEVHDGTDWDIVWTNGSEAIFDDEWFIQEIDVSDAVAGSSSARARFSQQSNGSGVACGWNVDMIEFFTPTVCDSSVVAPPPVPDGRFAPGAQMTAEEAAGDAVTISWDVSRCASPAYHLLAGTAGEVPVFSYDYSYSACSLETDGEATVEIPTPEVGRATWWHIVGADGSVEGIHGYTSEGSVRPATGVGFCGITEQSTAGSCP